MPGTSPGSEHLSKRRDLLSKRSEFPSHGSDLHAHAWRLPARRSSVGHSVCARAAVLLPGRISEALALVGLDFETPTSVRCTIMLSSRRAVASLRVPIGRFVLQVAAGALVVVALIAFMVSCAASPSATEDVGSVSSRLVVSGLFATGVDGSGTPLAVGATDPHYVLSSDDPAHPGPNAVVVAPVAGWVGNTSSSAWVSAQANAVGTALRNYTFTTTFTLTGVDPSTVAINGSWACDDTCVVSLNGAVVASYAAPGWTAVAAFTIPAGSGFVTGTNTLAFTATNSGGGATGLQVVSISGTSSGCTADNQCTIAQFCNTQSGLCVGTLPSGTPIPTITGHTPVLDGVCTTGVGEAVCDAGVCDMSNDECGLANGNGPCTQSNGATLCQSGACSQNGTCEPSGGCNVDADCASNQRCDVATHTCTAALDAGADAGEGGVDAGELADASEGGPEPDAGESDANEPEAGMVGSEAGEGGVGAIGSEGGEEGGTAIADGGVTADASPDATADAREEDAAEEASADAMALPDGTIDIQRTLEGDGIACSSARCRLRRVEPRSPLAARRDGGSGLHAQTA